MPVPHIREAVRSHLCPRLCGGSGRRWGVGGGVFTQALAQCTSGGVDQSPVLPEDSPRRAQSQPLCIHVSSGATGLSPQGRPGRLNPEVTD